MFVFNSTNRICGREAMERMTKAMLHRGPDEEGFYVADEIALGHRRLRIIDLRTGQQPLCNEDQSVWVVFNGEIYNFKELRIDLLDKGHRFKTASDTEVIVHLYEEYGEAFISKLSGMFSFGLWDGKAKRLILVRDRLGIKPLYYTITPNALLFASEIKAILAEGSINAEVEPTIIDRFLTYYYVPGNQTLFKGISKLEPGHYAVVENGGVTVKQYWDLSFASIRNSGNVKECADELEQLLKDTVRAYMISDVPVGVLLSGGVDSTAMLSFAAEETDKQISTFTVGFEGADCVDERPYARLAAERYGTRHYETTVSSAEFLTFLPKYVFHMEEPVCEPPAIALYYVSKLAREHVTVLLSGEGGDEVFAGYPNYRNLTWLERIKRGIGPMARPTSKVVSGLGRLAGSGRMTRYAGCLAAPLDQYYYSRTSGPETFFNLQKSRLYTQEFQESLRTSDPRQPSNDFFDVAAYMGTLSKMLYVDTKTWLPDDLLIKADKITMANSLELRVPLLDHLVVEFGASLSDSLKVNGLTTKYVLKKALERRVPAEIIKRKKAGFPVPYASWLKNEHKEVMRSVLLDSKSLGRGYFSKPMIEKLLTDNEATGEDAKEVFSLATLEVWHRIFIDGENVVL
jgi:asparagine synthase (glutamine-hydrolysing)